MTLWSRHWPALGVLLLALAAALPLLHAQEAPRTDTHRANGTAARCARSR
jgi:hypothetical protein